MQKQRKTNKGKKYKKSDTLSLPAARKLLPIDYQDLELLPKELRFVAAYCSSGFKSGESYYKAGYKSKTIQSKVAGANRLLNKPNIQEAIRRFITISIGPYKSKLEMEVLDIYYKRAFYEIDFFYDEDGKMLPLDLIKKEHPDYLVCIDGVERKYFGKDADVEVISWKLPDRDKAISYLANMVKNSTGLDKKDLPSDKKKKLEELFNSKKSKKSSVIEFDRTKAK